MTPIAGRCVLNAAQMRAAEAQAVRAGTSVDTLMERAGRGVADAVHRLASAAPVLVLCGPGNNGGDGYVVARVLAERGHTVRVAASAPPASQAAINARQGWCGKIDPIADAEGAPVVVDALFGTGLSRPLDGVLAERLCLLVRRARLSFAVDLPSGIATDDGRLLGPVPAVNVTLALGALKPAHLLQPARQQCGATRLIEIGIETASAVQVLAKPSLAPPDAGTYKYSRGYVSVVAGAMPGAAVLAATAALRGGAGYVALLDGGTGGPQALVRRAFDAAALDDPRVTAVLVGPGLGRGGEARAKLERALACAAPLVIDGDALHLVKSWFERGHKRTAPIVLTPHEGEFAALFGTGEGSKLERALAAAASSDATIVYKGADTVIATPQGQAWLSPGASPWLSSAGTGDVLSGVIAAFVSQRLAPLDAAGAGVWVHGEAARRLGAAFTADDLADALSPARAAL